MPEDGGNSGAKGRMNTGHERPASSGGEPSTPLFGSLSELDVAMGPAWNAMDPATTQMLLNLDEENHYLLKHDPLPLGDHELHVPTLSDDFRQGQLSARNGRNKRKWADGAPQNADAATLNGAEKAGKAEDKAEALSGTSPGDNPANTVPPSSKLKKIQVSKEAKADRERKRRERLNRCFDELSQACAGELAGSGGVESLVKTDRMGIIVDAIRVLKTLRVEVNQLRQLNKLMEERVGQLERGRMADAYSNYTMTRGVGNASDGGAGPSGLGGARGHMDLGGRGGHMDIGGHRGHMEIGGHGFGQAPQVRPGSGRLDAAGGNVAYLPPSNLSEDEKLRPPAA
jgi:hypothetical protein